MPIAKPKQTTTTSKSKTRKGGAFVGEGTYGCTFSPPVPCTDGRPLANKLGKVFRDPMSANKEFASVEVLRKIDPKQKLFIYPNESCDVTRGVMASEPRADECAFANKDDTRDTLKQLLMDYGGITASQFFKEYNTRATFSRASIVHIMEHAFYAVKQLILAKYVHQDIKTSNMVVLPGTNPNRHYEVKLIDFGTLVPFDKFANFNHNHLLGQSYFLSPPEYRVMGKILKLSPKSDVIAEYKLIETAVESQTIGEADIFNPAYFDSLQKLNKELMGKNKANRLMAFKAMNVADKSDIYSVGVMLLMLAQYAKPIADEDPKALALFIELIQGCMMPHPHDRWNIDQAIKAVRKLKALSTYNPHQKVTKTATAQKLYDIRQSKYYQEIFRKSPSAAPAPPTNSSPTPAIIQPHVRSSPTFKLHSSSSNSSNNSVSTPFDMQARMPNQSPPQARSNRRQTQY
jgi:hypothetical protein